MAESHAGPIRRLLWVQTVLVGVSAVAALPFGRAAAVSALIGAGACPIANALSAAVALRGYRAQEPERILMRIYGAELAKIATLLAVFALAFVALDAPSLPALLAAYLATQVLAPLIASQSDDRPPAPPPERTQK
jgi:ATP synthase protein I